MRLPEGFLRTGANHSINQHHKGIYNGDVRKRYVSSINGTGGKYYGQGIKVISIREA